MRAQKNPNKGACAGLRGYQEVMGEEGEGLEGMAGLESQKSVTDCRDRFSVFLIPMKRDFQRATLVSKSVSEPERQ